MKREQLSYGQVGRHSAKWASILLFAAVAITTAAPSARAAEIDAPAVVELTELPGEALAMQTVPADVNNPTGVSFTASPDHALIDSYELDILRPDSTVLQTLNLGKPTPDATNTITAPINVQPIAFANGYSARVRAKAGTAVSADALSLNKFNRVPGAPGRPTLK